MSPHFMLFSLLLNDFGVPFFAALCSSGVPWDPGARVGSEPRNLNVFRYLLPVSIRLENPESQVLKQTSSSNLENFLRNKKLNSPVYILTATSFYSHIHLKQRNFAMEKRGERNRLPSCPTIPHS